MANFNHISETITIFQERRAPEEGYVVGYAALIKAYNLSAVTPVLLSLISLKHKKYETDEWRIFTPRHKPENTLAGHLVFALKYEGVELAVLKKLFESIYPVELEVIVKKEPTGQYTRKIWFLYEWLLERKLAVSDLSIGNFVDLLDSKLQYAGSSVNSKRHRIRNNLPGVKDFCPIIRKTKKLEALREIRLSEKVKHTIGKIRSDILARAAAFLLLKDSKASYAIEGENPGQSRAFRWGRAIAQAGQKTLSKDELIRLQQIVIDNPRFLTMGLRVEEGFIGEHDRDSYLPVPDHISSKVKNLPQLMDGLITTNAMLEKDKISMPY